VSTPETVIDRAGDDTNGYPCPVYLPHSRDSTWNRCSACQRPMHEIRNTISHVFFGHLKPHSAKNLLETGFSGHLVPVLHDLLTQLPVAGVGLVELSGIDLPSVPLGPPAKK
jgi:hypothetical protein